MSPKSFTLDFGDYADEYVTMMTKEGENISQQLSGYIDIILKRKKDTSRCVDSDDSVVANEEPVGVSFGQQVALVAAVPTSPSPPSAFANGETISRSTKPCKQLLTWLGCVRAYLHSDFAPESPFGQTTTPPSVQGSAKARSNAVLGTYVSQPAASCRQPVDNEPDPLFPRSSSLQLHIAA